MSRTLWRHFVRAISWGAASTDPLGWACRQPHMGAGGKRRQLLRRLSAGMIYGTSTGRAGRPIVGSVYKRRLAIRPSPTSVKSWSSTQIAIIVTSPIGRGSIAEATHEIAYQAAGIGRSSRGRSISDERSNSYFVARPGSADSPRGGWLNLKVPPADETTRHGTHAATAPAC